MASSARTMLMQSRTAIHSNREIRKQSPRASAIAANPKWVWAFRSERTTLRMPRKASRTEKMNGRCRISLSVKGKIHPSGPSTPAGSHPQPNRSTQKQYPTRSISRTIIKGKRIQERRISGGILSIDSAMVRGTRAPVGMTGQYSAPSLFGKPIRIEQRMLSLEMLFPRDSR